MMLGFLLCCQSRTEQELSLWALLNPKLAQKIQAQECRQLLEELSELAIDLPLKHYQNQLDQHRQRELQDSYKTPEKLRVKLQQTIEYLERCSSVREQTVDKLLECMCGNPLQMKPVTKYKVINILVSFFVSYLRVG